MGKRKITESEQQVLNKLIFPETFQDILDETGLLYGELRDDLINLLNTVDLPIIMVGPDLRIRRFTPPAKDLMNLISGDIGRPLVDLKHPFPDLDLEGVILEVLDTLQVTTVELEDETGTAFELRVKPYRTSDDKIDGAVLVFWRQDRLEASTDPE
jgi:two-component system CheB/CheR fusion protein